MRLTFFFDYGMIGIDSLDEIKRLVMEHQLMVFSNLGHQFDIWKSF